MANIRVLDNSLINKIAAGEVVERPGAVVKELVENAVDAGAKTVVVEIKDGGSTLIRVTDNGSGIAKDEFKTAFLPHATSKIVSFGDLESVMTMGFRGEALASICAVSQMEALTKTVEDRAGTRLEIHGGELISEQETGILEGTTMIVRNLFYNTPARRKFLKKPSVESGYISDLLTKLILANPCVAIKYINNGSVILQTNGSGDLKSAIYSVYGKDAVSRLLELDYKNEQLKLSGFIGKPELCRANRAYENVFINGRYIKSDIICAAAEQAYRTKMMVGKFPVFVLNMSVEPTQVDVNVHPTKMEVRFSGEDEIYKSVFEAITKTLEKENLIPQITMPQASTAQMKNERRSHNPSILPPVFSRPEVRLKQQDLEQGVALPSAEAGTQDLSLEPGLSLAEAAEAIYKLDAHEEADREKPERSPDRSQSLKAAEKGSEPEKIFRNYKIIGQIFSTYWIVEQEGSIYLIDQHAAHEKVMYEKFMERAKNEKIASQKLLTPFIVKLSEAEAEILNDNADLLETMGFEWEKSLNNEYFIGSLPYIFDKPAGLGFFTEILDALADAGREESSIDSRKREMIASMSCKAAVKANDRLSYMEANELIKQIMGLKEPFNCPHGRPTIVALSKYEVEKMFKR